MKAPVLAGLLGVLLAAAIPQGAARAAVLVPPPGWSGRCCSGPTGRGARS